MHSTILKNLIAAPVAIVACAVPAAAGEVVLFGKAPDWVQPAVLDTATEPGAPSTLIADWQHRIEGGLVISYFDDAVRIDNPDAAREHGTVTLTWMPDKGDLTVHRAQIIRGGETIDLVADGAAFDVLRREKGLERRLISGELTATLAVPGLQVGDILRITHSVTIDDQALGDEVQVQQFLRPEPWKAQFARTVVSWPSGQDIDWRVEDWVEVADPVERDGYRWLTVALPLAKRTDMPFDAPWRYRRPAVLRVGSFADWQELSRVMYPHFAAAARVDADSEVAAQARAIMARSEDPLDRMAAAVRLVQDEISYLLDGLEGGNYLPQTADETWAKRYGDCKAKSVLLHALLQQMGIESETVLVHSRMGDAAPELLPVPGVFNHMIVHARVDGTDYWLDGTSSATRRASLLDVPPFHHALPLRADGAGLVAMVQREKPANENVISVSTDYSAGADFPAPVELTLTTFGPRGALMRKAVDEKNDDVLRRMGRGMARLGGKKGFAVASVEVTYDDELAAGTVKLRGVAGSEFEWKDGRLVFDPGLVPSTRFNANRAKREWRDIPVQTSGPTRNRLERQIMVPSDGAPFTFDGFDVLEDSWGNTRIAGTAALDGSRFEASVDVVSNLGEIAPEDIAATKRDVRRISAIETRLVAPQDMTWRWERDAGDLARRVAPIRALYDEAVAFADKDDHSPLAARAKLLAQAYMWDEALADYDALIEKDASAGWLKDRADVHRALGDDATAIADLEQAYDLEPDARNGTNLALVMAYAGRIDDALAIIDGLPVTDEDMGRITTARATTLGLGGRMDEALEAVTDAVGELPNEAWVLNADCWFRGLFAVELDDALANCTTAIERADNSAAMLDSRAMVHYRRGEMDQALADLDAALTLNPALAASRYMRGIILLERGEARGRKDVASALRMSPELARMFARHDIAPPK